MSTDIQMRARYTGNREICYRWVGIIGSGEVSHAQTFPGVKILSDTFSDTSPDARVTTATKVLLPAGLLVIDSSRSGNAGSHSYAAGVLDGADPKNTIAWGRARHVEAKRVDRNPAKPSAGKVTVHVVEVDGVRSEYRETV